MAPRRRNRRARRSGWAQASADAPAEERILDAAVELFAKSGYSGVSTRSIARRAKVNEASIYRYFASKRELFTAALERELQPLHVGPECLRRMAKTKSPRKAIDLVFQRIVDIVTQQPELMRLLQFSALEFGAAMKPVYRKHIGKLVGSATKHLQRWSERGALPRFHAEMTVLSFIATVVLAQNFYRFFARAPLVPANVKRVTESCADVWYTVLVQGGLAQKAATIGGPGGTRS